MQAAEIHARLGGSWPAVLAQLGIPETALRNKHGPCPACGGKDRFRFDNKRGRGDYICGQCGAGDGFRLLERVHGWPFAEARKRVIEAAGLSGHPLPALTIPTPRAQATEPPATPTERVRRLRRERCAIADCPDAIDYLTSRGLWPLPAGCTLSAHASADYFEDGKRIDRHPALLADVVDLAGELVTLHVTYLQSGRKLADHEARKTLTRMTGREGCAVRLMPFTAQTCARADGESGDYSNPRAQICGALGIAEGIETALSAAAIDGIPVWAALNTSLLAKFEPPSGVKTLLIYADRDLAGLEHAARLMERLRGRIRAGLDVELRLPAAQHKDFNDQLMGRCERPRELS